MFIGCVTVTADLGEAWQEVVGKRLLVQAIYCEVGFAEPTCALLAFEDGTFEVGLGEALRLYIELYKGADVEDASLAFVRQIAEFANTERRTHGGLRFIDES